MKNELRLKKIEIRVTQIEKEKIIEKSENVGLSISEYLRRSALEKKINAKFSEQEVEAWKNLTYISQSLKNLNNILNKENREELIKEIRVINEHLKKEIEKFF